MGLRGTAGIDINTRESTASNWRNLITKHEDGEDESRTSARYMLYRAIAISELPELHKLRLQQVTVENYRFYPRLKEVVQGQIQV